MNKLGFLLAFVCLSAIAQGPVSKPVQGGTGTGAVPATAQVLIGQPSGNYIPENITGCTLTSTGLLSCPANSIPPIGFYRKQICINGGPSCGSDPPIYQALVSDCGLQLALSAMRNGGGSGQSVNGVTIKLPAPADLIAAGYTSPVAGSGCVIKLIMSALAGNYVTIDPNGGKLTGAKSSIDITTPVQLPNHNANIISLTFNSLTWLIGDATTGESAAEPPFNFGQFLKHGDVRLILVNPTTACPQWVTGTTYGAAACVSNGIARYTTVAGGIAGATPPTWVMGSSGPTCSSDGTVTWCFSNYYYLGDIALCPFDGNGIQVGYTNSALTNQEDPFLDKVPLNCVMDNPTDLFSTGTATSLLYMKDQPSSAGSTTISAGNPNGTGTGTSAYFRLVFASTSLNNFGDQNIVCPINGADSANTFVTQPTNNLTTVTTTCWLARQVGSAGSGEPVVCPAGKACLDLLNPIAAQTVNTSAVSQFPSGDTQVTPYTVYYSGLAIGSLATGHSADPITGDEIQAGGSTAANNLTLVGMAHPNGGTPNSVSDTLTARNVASWFHPQWRKLLGATASPKTVTNTTTYQELDNSVRTNFVSFGAPGILAGLGALPRPVPWMISGQGSNGTNSDGCKAAGLFDANVSVAATDETVSFINGTVNGISFPLSVHGLKESLAEGAHTMSVGGLALTGGTCTFPTGFQFEAQVLQ